jgi:hypothetical protein
MSRNSSIKTFVRWATFLVCICIFGVLMGLRSEAISIWARAGFAVAAFVVLAIGVALVRIRKGKL